MQLVVAPEGEIRLVYAETIDFGSLGPTAIRRGSHVEPNEMGDWLADLEPVDGPRLGPFAKRSDAIKAEVAWLQEHWLVQSELSN